MGQSSRPSGGSDSDKVWLDQSTFYENGLDKKYKYSGSDSTPGELADQNTLLRRAKKGYYLNAPYSGQKYDPRKPSDLLDQDGRAVEISGHSKLEMSKRLSLSMEVGLNGWQTKTVTGIIGSHMDEIASADLKFTNPRLRGLIKRLPVKRKRLEVYQKFLKNLTRPITKKEQEELKSRKADFEFTKTAIERNLTGGDGGDERLNKLANSGSDHKVILEWFYNRPKKARTPQEKQKAEEEIKRFEIKSRSDLEEYLNKNPSVLKTMQNSISGYFSHITDKGQFGADIDKIISNPTGILTSSVLAGAIFGVLGQDMQSVKIGALIGAALNFPSILTNKDGGPSKVIGFGVGALAGGFFTGWAPKGAAYGAVALHPSSIGWMLKTAGASASTLTQLINHGMSGDTKSMYLELNRLSTNVKRYTLQIFDNKVGDKYGNYIDRIGPAVQETMREDIKNAPKALRPLLRHISFLKTGSGQELKGNDLKLALEQAGRFTGQTDHLSTPEDSEKILLHVMSHPNIDLNKKTDENKTIRRKYQLYYGDILKKQIQDGIITDPNLANLFDQSYQKGLQEVTKWGKNGTHNQKMEALLKSELPEGITLALQDLGKKADVQNGLLALQKKIPVQGYEFLKGSTSTLAGTLLTAYFMVYILASVVQAGGKIANRLKEEHQENTGKNLPKTFYQGKLEPGRRKKLLGKVNGAKNLGDIYGGLKARGLTRKTSILGATFTASLREALKDKKIKDMTAEEKAKLKTFSDIVRNPESKVEQINAAFFDLIKGIAPVSAESTNIEKGENEQNFIENMEKLNVLRKGETSTINLGNGIKVKFTKGGVVKRLWSKVKFLSQRIPVEVTDNGTKKDGKKFIKIYKSGDNFKYKLEGKEHDINMKNFNIDLGQPE